MSGHHKWPPPRNNKEINMYTRSSVLGFFGEYHFLSNFAASVMEIDGVTYPTNEHFYQAMKTRFPDERRHVVSAETPNLAKKRGRNVTLRSDWDNIKMAVMLHGLRNKFAQNQVLLEALLSTTGRYLEETNTWGDTFWGVCDGAGSNHLGKALMTVRTEFYLPRLGVNEDYEQASLFGTVTT